MEHVTGSRGQVIFAITDSKSGRHIGNVKLGPIQWVHRRASLGILIGDGQLNYRREQILEAYYAYSLNKWATLTFDYQFVNNPGYNADRGPVSVFSGRFHAEF